MSWKPTQARLLNAASWAFLLGGLFFAMAFLALLATRLLGAPPKLVLYFSSSFLLGAVAASGLFAAVAPHLRCPACQETFFGLGLPIRGVLRPAPFGLGWLRLLYSVVRRRAAICPKCSSTISAVWRAA